MGKPSFYSDCTELSNNNNYVEVANRVKSNNITKENIGAIMLSQIPKVSTAIALAVMREHKTIEN